MMTRMMVVMMIVMMKKIDAMSKSEQASHANGQGPTQKAPQKAHTAEPLVWLKGTMVVGHICVPTDKRTNTQAYTLTPTQGSASLLRHVLLFFPGFPRLAAVLPVCSGDRMDGRALLAGGMGGVR